MTRLALGVPKRLFKFFVKPSHQYVSY